MVLLQNTWELLLLSLQPVVEFMLLCGVGAWLAQPSVNIFPSDARDSLNKLVFFVFSPAFVFSKLGDAVDATKAIEWWYLPVNVLIVCALGYVIGILVVWICKPPQQFHRLTIACCTIGNIGNLPLVLVDGVCSDTANPFGDEKHCLEDGVAKVTFGMWMAVFVMWTFIYNFLKPQEVPDFEVVGGTADHLAGVTHDDKALIFPLRNGTAASSEGSEVLEVVTKMEKHSDFAEGKGEDGSRGSTLQLTETRTSIEACNIAVTELDVLPNTRDGQGNEKERAGQGEDMIPQAEENHLEDPHLSLDGRKSSRMVWKRNGDVMYQQLLVPKAMDQESPQPASGTERICPPWENLRVWRRWLIANGKLRDIFTPPTTAAALALIVGVIPPVKGLFFGPGAPLQLLTHTLDTLGGALIPSMCVTLGGNLALGPGRTALGMRTIVGITIARLVLLPLVGLGVVPVAGGLGLIPPQDPMLRFVLLLQFACPTAINLGTVAQLHGVGASEASAVLFWGYLLCGFPLIGFMVICFALFF